MYNITAVKGNLKLDLSSFFKDITDAKQVAKDVAIKEAESLINGEIKSWEDKIAALNA
jgi:hypothetical protein